LLLSYLTDDLAFSWPWEKWYHRIFRKIDTRLLLLGLNRVSILITMTVYLAKKWGPRKANVVIPAIVPGSSLRAGYENKNISSFNIVYSGGLEEHFGLRILLETFHRSPYTHWKLIITGKGSLDREVTELASVDNRIIYKGLVPFSELDDVYKSASIFVNPRPSSDERTRFLFPSKIVEQMVTGKPVISTDLACLTDQFREHLLIVAPETSDRLLEVLIQADHMGEEERASRGSRAKEFVIQNYSPPVVGRLIFNEIRKFEIHEQE
jgi:glycosyltransferase involved in cell wall biosynthesis